MAALLARQGGEVTREVHDRAARGFDRAAEDYERGRPEYPASAIDLLASELGVGAGSTVLDLAAGTGKLTRGLIPTGARVVAVEPVPGMREQLMRAVPAAEVLAGTAEKIPLPDQAVEAVLVAQAFHWFDVRAAAAEIHRVLRTDGGLGVVYNDWDDSVEWVARMQELVGAHRGDTPQRTTSGWREQLAATGLFTSLTDRTFPNLVYGTLEVMLSRIASISFIATLAEETRSKVLADVRQLVAEYPDAWAQNQLAMPYVTRVTWCYTTDATRSVAGR